MCTDRQKLEKLQNKFKKFEKEIADFADTLEFVMKITMKHSDLAFYEYFLYSSERTLKNIQKIMKK